ncbi:MAG: MFS transporter [Myxococcales bacterium]
MATRATFLREAVASRTRGLPAAFWTIWCGLVVNRLASFVLPFLSIYLVRDRGFLPAQAGRVLALYGVGVTVAGPLGGFLADSAGRRITMVLALALGAAAVCTLTFTRKPVLLGAMVFLCAAASDMYRPAMSAAVADVVAPVDRPRAYGLTYWAVNFATSVGLLVGALVAERSLVALFLADAGTSIAAATLILARVPETRPMGIVHESALRGLARVFSDGPYLSFLLLHLGALVVFAQWEFALPLDMAAHGLGPSAYAFLMALNCLGVVVLQPIVATRLYRFDAARALALSTVLFGAGYGVNAVGGSMAVYALGTAFWTIGEVIWFPVASTMVANLAPAELRGRYQGAFSMCWGVAFVVSPLAAGELMQRSGAPSLWLSCFGLSLVVGAAHLATAEPRRKRMAALLQAQGEAAPAVSG